MILGRPIGTNRKNWQILGLAGQFSFRVPWPGLQSLPEAPIPGAVVLIPSNKRQIIVSTERYHLNNAIGKGFNSGYIRENKKCK